MLFRFSVAFVLAGAARCLNALQIVNGQIYSPGIAVVDSPQPNTPLGGGESLNTEFFRMLQDADGIQTTYKLRSM
jgi:hypothetical protein